METSPEQDTMQPEQDTIEPEQDIIEPEQDTMEPPPEQEFDDLKQATALIHSHAKQNSFALTKTRMHMDKRQTVQGED